MRQVIHELTILWHTRDIGKKELITPSVNDSNSGYLANYIYPKQDWKWLTQRLNPLIQCLNPRLLTAGSLFVSPVGY